MLFILFAAGSAAVADGPLLAPSFYKVCSPSVSYCASVAPNSNINIYKVDADFNGIYVYSVPGWHREFFLSDEGKYSAIGYHGLSLVGLNAHKNTIILTILKNGIKVHEITLEQVLSDVSSMRLTSSHYYWGRNIGFRGCGFFIETVEEKYICISPENGQISVAG